MTIDTRIILTNVSHAYGDFVAARNVDLTIDAGEVHCLLGPSGSGKSTLLRLVAGLEHLQSGSIAIGDRMVAGPKTHVRPEDRSVGFVFQDYALFPHLNVLKNVLFGMGRLPKVERKDAAHGLLRQVGMEEYAQAMPHTLSGGQQQRVALARALAPKPRIMLLDEPFSGLDVQLRGEVREATLGLLKSTGVATLMVTHDPREALNTGNVISVIRQGRIIQTGSPEQVYRRSADREVAEIFGPVNALDGKVRDGRVESLFGPLSTPLQEGTEVDLIFRPESLHLDHENAESRIAATVTSTTKDGGTVLVGLRLSDGKEIHGLSLERTSWSVGDSAYVGLELEAVMILPKG